MWHLTIAQLVNGQAGIQTQASLIQSTDQEWDNHPPNPARRSSGLGWGIWTSLRGQGRSVQEGEAAGSSPSPSPGPSPGQPVGQEEVLLDVIDQGAPHFLHHLEDSLKVVKLQGS